MRKRQIKKLLANEVPKQKTEAEKLQEAWDLVCDHLDKHNPNGAHTFFTDSYTVYNKISISSIYDSCILVSTKEY